MPYRIVGEDAVAHDEIGTLRVIHPPSAGQCSFHRIEGEVAVGDRDTSLVSIEKHTTTTASFITHDAVVGEGTMVNGRTIGKIKTQTTTAGGRVATLSARWTTERNDEFTINKWNGLEERNSGEGQEYNGSRWKNTYQCVVNETGVFDCDLRDNLKR